MTAVTSNLRLAEMPGNVLLDPGDAGLDRPSVIDVTQIDTIDLRFLDDRIGTVPRELMAAVDAGLRLVLRL